MRTKEERKILHTSSIRTKDSNNPNATLRGGFREEIVSLGGKFYKRIQANQQVYFMEMKTEKE